MPALIYLSGPIDNLPKNHDPTAWRSWFLREWGEKNCLDPIRHSHLMQHRPMELVEVERVDIQACDVLVYFCFRASFASPMELMLAHSLGKRTLLINRLQKPLSPWLRYHATVIVPRLAEALAWLKENTS